MGWAQGLSACHGGAAHAMVHPFCYIIPATAAISRQPPGSLFPGCFAQHCTEAAGEAAEQVGNTVFEVRGDADR